MRLPKNAQYWLAGYVRNRLWALKNPKPARCRVWLLLADHYEPLYKRPTHQVALARVDAWAKAWPEIAARHRDSQGRKPVYTFFYPQEEYHPEFLDPLARMTSDGIGDVEVHIHHGGEGEREFLDRMHGFIGTLRDRHGLLRTIGGRTVFAFIHGNWALDNARRQYCGLNNEIQLLRDMGCYADYTMPSGTDNEAQASWVNTIMWVTDNPGEPKSYDRGVAVRPGHFGSGDLLMIPGPMGVRYGERLMPRIESAELAHQDLATPYRVSRWLDLAPRLGADIFLKLHAHGANDLNSRALLGSGGLDLLFTLLAAECARRGYEWRSVSAWQMRQAVEQAARLRNPVEGIYGGYNDGN